MRHSPQSLARRLASPLFLPAASPYHEVLTVAQLDKAGAFAPRLMPLALIRILPRVLTSLPNTPPTPTSPTYLFPCRDCGKTCGWSGGEGRDASSALGFDEEGDDDMDNATRAAIARA
jgi:hypothetical protein